jgi:hypothetical protein
LQAFERRHRAVVLDVIEVTDRHARGLGERGEGEAVVLAEPSNALAEGGCCDLGNVVVR